MSSMPVSCRYGVTCRPPRLKASCVTAAGADNAAAARFTDAGAATAVTRDGDGQGGGAAGAPAGVQVAVVAQLRVRRGDGRAGHPQSVGERPLAGQPRPDRKPAVDDQHPDAVGQALVGRAAAIGGAPVAQLAGQEVHIERPREHFHCHFQASMRQLAIERQASWSNYREHEHELDLATGTGAWPPCTAGPCRHYRRGPGPDADARRMRSELDAIRVRFPDHA